MQVTVRAATQFDDTKKIGLAQFDVVEFNKEFDSDGKEIKYLGEKDGDTTFRVAITLKEKKSGKYFPLSYFLQDKQRLTQDGLKTWYINQWGWKACVGEKEGLSEKFRSVDFHVARVGEIELTDFIQGWLNIDRNASVDLTLDWKALMKGSTKELAAFLKTDLPRQDGVLAMATVRVAEKEGEIKEYQGIFGKVLPGFNMKFFKNPITPEYIQKLRDNKKAASENKSGWLKSYEDFILDVTDYCKDAYTWGGLRDYNPEENLVATDVVLSEEDSNY